MGPSGQQGPLESSIGGCREEEAVCKNSCTKGSIHQCPEASRVRGKRWYSVPQSALGECEPGVLRRDPANSQHCQASPASLSSQNHTVLISLLESLLPQLCEGQGRPS